MVDPRRFRRFPPRARGTWKLPPQPWDDPEQRAIDSETLSIVGDAVTKLPVDQRVVVTMRDLLGWSAPEVCAALELTETNQRVLLHRGRSKIRAALEHHYEEERRS